MRPPLNQERAAGKAADEWRKTFDSLSEAEKSALEEQLRQSQKLEAIGLLAGGVAHDFNNLLGSIMGSAELLRIHFGGDLKANRFIERIITSTSKAADLTRQLLTFACKARVNITQINIHTGIENVIGLLEHTIDRRIEIVKRFDTSPLMVMADSNMFENALLNIAINARDAMPQGGKITLSTGRRMFEGNSVLPSGETVIPGAYVYVAVTDTGTGITGENMERIFDPFFTTKEAGKGTGLGLASVYGCVRQHTGYLTVDSTVGAGTTYTIFLPESRGTIDSEDHVDPVPMEGRGNILVVDDEPDLADTLGEILKKLGYEPVVYSDPLEALEYFEKNASAIDAVILDIIMSKTNGLDLFRSLKKLHPDVKVIVASGYSDNDQEKLIMQEGARLFVGKPYRIYELSKAIAGVLGEQ